MATCQCGTVLPGRQQKCDACKARPGGRTPAGVRSRGSESEAPTVPPGLHDRGAALWKTLGQSPDTVAGQIALEACRTADRLDELNHIIAGRGVLDLLRFRAGREWEDDLIRQVHITVDLNSVLSESRQQAASFAKLLGELDAPAAPLPQDRKKTPLDELTARRQAKS